LEKKITQQIIIDYFVNLTKLLILPLLTPNSNVALIKRSKWSPIYTPTPLEREARTCYGTRNNGRKIKRRRGLMTGMKLQRGPGGCT